jgi:hypothetical protein
MGHPDWWLDPGRAPGFGEGPKFLEAADEKPGEFWWDRQVAFLKGKTARSPNYFVFRDSVAGQGRLKQFMNLNFFGRRDNVKIKDGRLLADTGYPASLEVAFTQHDPLRSVTQEYEQQVGGTWRPRGEPWQRLNLHTPPENRPPFWVDKDQKPWGGAGQINSSPFEQQLLMRMEGKPGGDWLWVAYPRGEGEASPRITRLAEGVLRIETPESIDTLFLSTKPTIFRQGDITFEGHSGVLRHWKDGKTTFALFGGPGRLSYKGRTLASDVPAEKTLDSGQALEGPEVDLARAQPTVRRTAEGTRITLGTRRLVQVRVGPHAIRGLGPFDLTFSDDAITGTVEGDTRTLVTSIPANVVRPMYLLDGRRWMSGMPDEPSPWQAGKETQFAHAIGVPAGKHTIEIREWEWPAQAPRPRRRTLRLAR